MGSAGEDLVIRGFAEAVRAKLGSNVQRIVLFGSRARGTAEQGADYDMAVVVSHRTRDVEERVLDAAVEILDRYDALVSAHVFTPAEWEIESQTPLGLNINKEGVLV